MAISGRISGRILGGSAAGEGRLALLQEGGHAFAHVRGGRGEAEHVGLDDLALLLAHVEAAADRLRVTGALTIKGVTRDVVLDVEVLGQAKDPWGNERAAFSATTAIDRREFGLTWNQVLETGGVMVGERIDIAIEIEAVRQVAAQVA